MKRVLSAIAAVVALVGIPAPSQADSIKLYDVPTGRFGTNATGTGVTGGPFSATTTGTLLGDSTFPTFCLEYNENLDFNTTYEFTLSDGARSGGVSGGTNGIDPLSDATKWLYLQAVTGQYESWYAGNPLFYALNSNVGATFQYAIWYLEGERSVTQLGGTDTAGYQVAQYALGHAGDWVTLAGQGHQVYAMNLQTVGCNTTVSPTCDQVQDVLAYTPATVPEPGSTILLLGTGVFGLMGARRKWPRR